MSELIDNEVKSLRAVDNLKSWEMMIDKYHNLPYNKQIATIIKNNSPIRMILNKNEPTINEKKAYIIAKHLVNSGISPSNICITNLEDCYLSVRGFGDMAKIKDKIFKSDNELIIIENLREIRQTDIKDNVYSFWQEFWAYCRKNRKLNVLLCFDTGNNKDWYPRETNKSPHKELGFIYG